MIRPVFSWRQAYIFWPLLHTHADPPACSQCHLSQQHPHPWGVLRGRVYLGVFHPSSTPHPRRKHEWQMGHTIRYQVSARKICNVTKQWVTDIKKTLLIYNQSLDGFFSTTANSTLVSAAIEKMISPLSRSVFPSMQHRLGTLTKLNRWPVAHQEDMFWCAVIKDREVRHSTTCCCEMEEVPTCQKGSKSLPGTGTDRQLSVSGYHTIVLKGNSHLSSWLSLEDIFL